jgi:DNA-directed RNA polymerase specialized sigma24 family protein
MTPELEKSLRAVLTSAHLDFEKKLNIHAFFKLNDHALGEDIVQDTFMKTWVYLVRGGEDRYNEVFSLPYTQRPYY